MSDKSLLNERIFDTLLSAKRDGFIITELSLPEDEYRVVGGNRFAGPCGQVKLTCHTTDKSKMKRVINVALSNLEEAMARLKELDNE